MTAGSFIQLPVLARTFGPARVTRVAQRLREAKFFGFGLSTVELNQAALFLYCLSASQSTTQVIKIATRSYDVVCIDFDSLCKLHPDIAWPNGHVTIVDYLELILKIENEKELEKVRFIAFSTLTGNVRIHFKKGHFDFENLTGSFIMDDPEFEGQEIKADEMDTITVIGQKFLKDIRSAFVLK